VVLDNKIKVSIIVPVYNAEKFIEKCLQSLVDQSLKEIEIICVNDFSKDNSEHLIKSYVKKYPNKISLINLPENRRQGGARNAGISVAGGEYLGFVDSDDWIHKDMYKVLYECAYENCSDVVDSGLIATDGFSELYSESKADEVVTRKDKMILNFGRLVTKIIKKTVFTENNIKFPEHTYYEDNYILPFLAINIKSIRRINRDFYYYFYNNESTTKKVSMTYFERMTSANAMLDDFKGLTDDKDINDAVVKKFFYFHSIGTIYNALGKFNVLPKDVINKIKTSEAIINGRNNIFSLYGINVRTVIYYSTISFPSTFRLFNVVHFLKRKIKCHFLKML
jgi:glycosyltransferase involved in cell wall biosynthesis